VQTPDRIPDADLEMLVRVIRDLEKSRRSMSFAWLLRRISPGVEEIEESLWAEGDYLDLSQLNENPHARLFFWKERCLDRRRLLRILDQAVTAGFLERIETRNDPLFRPTAMGREWCELVQSPPKGPEED